VPEACRGRVAAPPPSDAAAPLGLPFAEREDPFSTKQETAWLVLERRGDRAVRPALAFLGGRVKKRLDYFNFVLAAVDLATGKTLWQGTQNWGDRWTDELRLKGKGNEPGFFEAFVCGDGGWRPAPGPKAPPSANGSSRAVVVVHGLYDVLAFALADGKLRWRYQVPFDFEIRHALMSGDLLVLAGRAETVALYVPTDDPRGEVAWQEKEEGDLYIPPSFCGDRLVSFRKLPFNATVRYRATGKLLGRLALPDLSLHDAHPLLDDGPRQLPVARDGKLFVVSDGWYYIAVDTDRMKVVWKRLIDQNDPTREPALRLALKGDYLAVVKEDFDRKAIYMLSSRTGEILWHTDPKDGDSPQPMHSMVIAGDAIYGIGVHPGQGFYFVGLDCRTGKRLFKRNEQAGYQGKPEVALLPTLFGPHAVAPDLPQVPNLPPNLPQVPNLPPNLPQVPNLPPNLPQVGNLREVKEIRTHAIALVKDRQDFEVKAFDVRTGSLDAAVRAKGVGDFGEHGRVSATVQDGKLVLFSKDKLITALGPRPKAP